MPKKIIIITNAFVKNVPIFNRPYSMINKYFTKNIFKTKIIPLFNKLDSKDDVRIIPLDRSSVSFLKKYKVPITDVSNYFKKGLEKRILTKSDKLLKKIEESSVSLNKSWNYNGISLWELEKVDGWGYFSYEIVKLIEYIEDILKTTKPDVVYYYDNDYLKVNLVKKIMAANKIKFIPIKSFFPGFVHRLEKTLIPLLIKKISNKNLLPLKRISSLKSNGNPSTDTIIFLDNSDLSDHAIDFANRLKKDKKNVLVIAVEDLPKPFEREGIRFNTFGSYLNDKIKNNNIEFTKRSNRAWKSLCKNVKLHKQFTYNKINIWEDVKNMFRFYFKNRFNLLANYVDVLKRIFDLEMPKSVLLFDDIGVFGKTIAKSAKDKNIKVITLQHGVFSDIPITNTCSDVFAAYGDHTKEILVKNGSNPYNIKLVGDIKLDKLPIFINKHKEVCNELKISPNKKIITLITEPGPIDQSLIKETIKAAKSMKDLNLVFKLHPGENDFERYRKIAKEEKYRITLIKNYSLYKLLSSTSIVILVDSSTVGLESLFFGIPLIQFKKRIRMMDDWYPLGNFYIDEKVAIEVNSKEEIVNSIDKLLNDKKTKEKFNLAKNKFIRRHAYKPDGKAKKRVMEIIKEFT